MFKRKQSGVEYEREREKKKPLEMEILGKKYLRRNASLILMFYYKKRII